MRRPAREEILAAELRVLQALCAGTPEGPVRQEGVRRLAGYRFADPIHQLVFDTLREIKSEQPEIIREQLAVRLTRQGFPAVDLEKFFAADRLARQEVLALTDQLVSGAAPKEVAGA